MPGPQHILIVEDDVSAQEYFTSRIRRDFPGIQVTLAGTLAQAKVVLATERIDAMLIDPGLPDSQGFATFKILIELAPYAAVVGMTGYVDPEVKRQTLAQGAQGYYDKFELMVDWQKLALLKQLRAEVEAEHGGDSADRPQID